ncbi:hypothetical protein HYFRA_00000400 [Hymenoscyphus fraxineus]|uniref:BTB domain-containing protein n=1 Tax=Hymenoscyphus fraxineus TaxID=746836 RepID=A0A9N9PSI2_9HELO|nr:hypothetical protein HYFRA_00000400 [Hymenoscyphus fraxineus]
MSLRKDQLEIQLKEEHQLIQEGKLRDESPLDLSQEFYDLCYACRIGDLKGCQEAITKGVNINARDAFDYTPLILASLCGNYETVQLLLESGALCERDTFQGERCLYNALNNRIRQLLLSYDYSKSFDPLQPFASHITSLLARQKPKTTDISLTAGSEAWNLHKFILSARSPYFAKKLLNAPETTVWKLPNTIPSEAFHIALRYLYLGGVPLDLGLSGKGFVTEDDVFKGIDKVSKQLEIESLVEGILAGGDRRLARQRHQDEMIRASKQIEDWYRGHVLKHKLVVDSSKARDVKWTRDNSIFADVLLCASEGGEEDDADPESDLASPKTDESTIPFIGIPIGPASTLRSPSPSRPPREPKKSVLFPVHRAMLLRSEYFQTMFTSDFQEAQIGEFLNVIPVACTPDVLQIVLTFLYTEKADIPIELALDVLFAADMLFIEALKTKAAVVISTLGNGTVKLTDNETSEEVEVEPINVYDVIRAGWFLKIQRLEHFSARYLAYRLEDYIDEEDFEELIRESASRIENRQETDTIELLDDIRHYLSERFRLGFEDSGLEEIMDENGEIAQDDGSKPTSNDVLTDEAIDMNTPQPPAVMDDHDLASPSFAGGVKTLDGRIAEDELEKDALNHQILLNKIDLLLDRLKLDA